MNENGKQMKKIELIFDKDKEFTGPNIVELEPILAQLSEIGAPWTHTKDELRIIGQYPNTLFTLYISDISIFDRAVAAFGLRIKLSSTILERAKIVLQDPKAYDWRKFLQDQPGLNHKYVLLQLATDAIRKGKQPNLSFLMESLFIHGVSPVDADILLRLKSPRIKG